MASASGCTSFDPLPLHDPRGGADVASLTADLSQMPLPELKQHPFNASDGLDVIETAMLAVANAPTLRTKRAQVGVTQAQAFSAGLLPDPQLTFESDRAIAAASGLVSAYNMGLSWDLAAVVQHTSAKEAGQSQLRQANLELLWMEWQTIAQAKLLFLQTTVLREQSELLKQALQSLQPVETAAQKALANGTMTRDTAAAAFTTVSDLRRRVDDTAVALHQAEFDLRQLLGLAPDAPLPLIGGYAISLPSDAQVHKADQELTQRRPDLLALQAGYDSANAQLRGAIRAQFPMLSLGTVRARDTSNLRTQGMSLGLSLPLFNRNRGNIAIARATRQQLKAEYEERVLATRNDTARLLADLRAQQTDYVAALKHAEAMGKARDAATTAWQAHRLDWGVYLGMQANAFFAQSDLIALRQSCAATAIALETLLGRTDFATEPLQ